MRRTFLLVLLCLGGCAATSSHSLDPCFDRAWNADASNREIQSRSDYLRWVDSFYQGVAFQPGWVRRQSQLSGTLAPAEALLAEPRLEALGRTLAAEWAKDNRIRRVNTELLLRVAEILADARDDGRLIGVLDALLGDVRSLIAGGLEATVLTSDRYAKVLVHR